MIRTFKNNNNSRKAWIFLGLLAIYGSAFTPVAAFAQSDRDTVNRIKRMENEIQTLSRAIYKGEAPPPGSFSGGSEDSAALNVRLDQLETQLRDMNGKIEEQNHQVQQLKDQMERMSGDIDMRLNNVSSVGNTAPRYTATPAYEPAPEPQTQAPPQPPMTATTQGNSNYQWSSNNNGEPTLGTLNSVAAPNDAGAIAYENAFSLLKNGQYDAAEQGFATFLAQYPGHQLSGNAKYWLGESYYARGQYENASRVFAQAYQEFPKGAKAPDNLLKLGLSLAGMGKKQDACIALAQIEKEFSASAGPVLQRAQQEMKHFGCS